MYRASVVSIFVGIVFVSACTPDGTTNTTAQSLQVALNACELLPAEEGARLLGSSSVTSLQTMDSVNGAYALSQCTYRPENAGGRLTVQVSRSGVPIAQSRLSDANKWRAEDDGTGFSIQVGDAIEQGRDLDGFSGVAYTYGTRDATHVVAYAGNFHQVDVTVSAGALNDGEALQAAVAAAKAVVGRLDTD